MKMFILGVITLSSFYYGLITCKAIGKFKKDGDTQDSGVVNATHAVTHEQERALRNKASIIVVVIFLFVTVGMFLCCRVVPEILMEKCNLV